MTPLNDTVQRVTDRIIARSEGLRGDYLARMSDARAKGPARAHLSCSGQAHAYAASGPDKDQLARVSAGTTDGSPAMWTAMMSGPLTPGPKPSATRS